MMFKARPFLFVPFLLGLASTLMLVACSSGASVKGTTVRITEKDFSLSSTSDTVATGKVIFEITNQGPSTHEFVIIRTDEDADELPFDSSISEVNENDAGLQHVQEAEDIKPGKDKKLTVNLQPGHYAFICNLPGHYRQGMHFDFTVS
jgi:uncharacterized cupredoxin-like copper-binding protein